MRYIKSYEHFRHFTGESKLKKKKKKKKEKEKEKEKKKRKEKKNPISWRIFNFWVWNNLYTIRVFPKMSFLPKWQDIILL